MRSWTCQSDSTSSTRVRLVAPRVSQTAEERPSHPQPTSASVASHPARHRAPECFRMCVWDYATTTAPWCQLQYNKANITRSQQHASLRSTSDIYVYINSARKLRSMCQVNMSAATVSERCCVQTGQSQLFSACRSHPKPECFLLSFLLPWPASFPVASWPPIGWWSLHRLKIWKTQFSQLIVRFCARSRAILLTFLKAVPRLKLQGMSWWWK